MKYKNKIYSLQHEFSNNNTTVEYTIFITSIYNL